MPTGQPFQAPTEFNPLSHLGQPSQQQFGQPGQPGQQPFNPFQAAPEQRSLLDRLKEFFIGRPEELGTIQRHDPQQQQLLDQITQLVSGGLQGGQAPQLGPIEDLARQQFSEQTIPDILQQFGTQGSGSSALQAALQQGGAGLEKQLAGLRYQQLQNLLPQALSSRFEPFARPGTQGILQDIQQQANRGAIGIGTGFARGGGL